MIFQMRFMQYRSNYQLPDLTKKCPGSYARTFSGTLPQFQAIRMVWWTLCIYSYRVQLIISFRKKNDNSVWMNFDVNKLIIRLWISKCEWTNFLFEKYSRGKVGWGRIKLYWKLTIYCLNDVSVEQGRRSSRENLIERRFWSLFSVRFQLLLLLYRYSNSVTQFL